MFEGVQFWLSDVQEDSSVIFAKEGKVWAITVASTVTVLLALKLIVFLFFFFHSEAR